MAFFDRHSSAPSLVSAGTARLVLRPLSSELSDKDSITSEPYSTDILDSSRRSEGGTQSLSDSEHSPVNMRKERRKKRRAPPPPSGLPPPYPSPGSLRHSYSFERNKRPSSGFESLSTTYDCSRSYYNTSTDSENLPESATSTVSDQEQSPTPQGLTSPRFSPRDKSRLWTLKNALRSPRNPRKNSKKESKDEDGKTFRVRKKATIEPPDCCVWTLALLSDDVWEPDTEFEVSLS